MKKFILAAVALAFSLAVSLPSARAEAINFQGGAGGSLSFTPGLGNTLDIVDAPIDLVFTVLLALGGSHAVSGTAVGSAGALSFTSGPLGSILINDAFSFAGLFGGGGSVSIVGGVADFGIADGTTLLAATFVPGTSFASLSKGFGAGNFSGLLQNIIVEGSLLSALNFNSQPGGGSLSEVFIDVTWDGSTFSGGVGSTNLAVTPEPASLLLLGSGMLAGAAYLRKRFPFGRK